MSTVKVPTPVPPPEKRVQWLPPSNGSTANGVKLLGLNSPLNSGDLPPAQPSKLQRPQSAVVHSASRRPSAQGPVPDLRHSSDSIKIPMEGSENERREIPPKISADFGPGVVGSGRPHTSGGEGSSAGRNRPQSAMPSMSRAGSVPSAEKLEIEDLKREIMELTKRINSNRKELIQQHGGNNSGLGRVSSVDETESALKRFITTSDPTQVQMAKNTLLCMVLQKHEELHRDTLSALSLQHGAGAADVDNGRTPRSSGSLGSARDKSNNSRSATMLALVDMTRSLSDQVSGMKDQTNSAASELEEAKGQIRKLTEERELLRATLTQAGASGKGATVKIVRPVSAPRARAVAPLSDRPSSARDSGACQGCELLEVRIHETHMLLKAAEERNQVLAGNIEALSEEKLGWQRRAPANKIPDSPTSAPPPAPAAPPPAAGTDGAKEIAALKKKVTDLEKLLAGKTKEAKDATESAEAAKSKAEKLAKENKEKDAKIKDLEKQLAEALAKVSTLEKRLNDVSLNLKATGESSDGAVARERELLKQIECLTKEMTEARNETDKYKVMATKAEAATEKLQGKLDEERSEADAIQKKLIGDLRDAKARLAEAQAANALLQRELEKALARVAVLEAELATLQGKPKKTDDLSNLEALVAELTKKHSACQGQLSTAQERCSQLDKEKQQAVSDLQTSRQRFDAREREVRLQVERRETEFAAEREELQRRIRELEALLSGSGGDKAELTLLRTKVKQLQDTLEKEVRCSQDQQRNAKDAEDEARVVRGDLKVLKEKLEKSEKAEKDKKSEVEDLRKKLLAAMRRADAADATLMKIEGEREETRTVENAFKAKMKTLYEKRVRELESMQQDFEQRMMKEAEERLRNESSNRGGGAGAGGGVRPSTAASALGAGRRR